jgi:hypothetical protein
MGAVLQDRIDVPAGAPDWHREMISLHEQDLSERQIAEAVGKAPSTVHEALAKYIAANTPPLNGNGGEPTPGQLTIDGGEVPAEAEPVGEVRVDGLKQLGLIDFGGKRPQSATLTLRGGQFELEDHTAFEKGDRLFFAGQAQVFSIEGRDKLDAKTMIATTAVQKHVAQIFELHSGDEEQVLIGLFRALVGADRQKAAALADAFVREANGGASG